MEEDEDALLAQAIALSMQENTDDASMPDAAAANATPAPATPAPAAAAAVAPGAPTSAATAAAAATPAPTSAADMAADIDLAMQDPDFINSLLAGVPGAEGESVDVSRTPQVAQRQQETERWRSLRSRFSFLVVCI